MHRTQAFIKEESPRQSSLEGGWLRKKQQKNEAQGRGRLNGSTTIYSTIFCLSVLELTHLSDQSSLTPTLNHTQQREQHYYQVLKRSLVIDKIYVQQ